MQPWAGLTGETLPPTIDHYLVTLSFPEQGWCRRRRILRLIRRMPAPCFMPLGW